MPWTWGCRRYDEARCSTRTNNILAKPAAWLSFLPHILWRAETPPGMTHPINDKMRQQRALNRLIHTLTFYFVCMLVGVYFLRIVSFYAVQKKSNWIISWIWKSSATPRRTATTGLMTAWQGQHPKRLKRPLNRVGLPPCRKLQNSAPEIFQARVGSRLFNVRIHVWKGEACLVPVIY